MIRHKGTLHAGVENGHNENAQNMAVHGVSKLLGARGYADDVWLHGDAEVLLRHRDDVKDIILTATGMELQPRKSLLLLPRERLDGDPVCRGRANGCSGACTWRRGHVDAFIEGQLETMMEKHIEELEAVKCFPKQFQWIFLLLCFNQRMTQ